MWMMSDVSDELVVLVAILCSFTQAQPSAAINSAAVRIARAYVDASVVACHAVRRRLPPVAWARRTLSSALAGSSMLLRPVARCRQCELDADRRCCLDPSRVVSAGSMPIVDVA